MGANYTHKFARLFTRTFEVGREILYSTSGHSTTGAFNGITGAASSTVVVPTVAVTSGALMTLVVRPMAVNSGDAGMPQWVVRSLNPGVGFTAGTVCSYALTSSYQLHWTVAQRV